MTAPTHPPESRAVISACGAYRYLLTRKVGSGKRIATFVMLNPSTADGAVDDPTIRRCLGFARSWGCGGLAVLNLFAFRATHPADLKKADDPVGPENQEWFDRTLATRHEGPVICAWGNQGGHKGQHLIALGWLQSHRIRPMVFGITRGGHPRHPLYLPFGAGLELMGRGWLTSCRSGLDRPESRYRGLPSG